MQSHFKRSLLSLTILLTVPFLAGHSQEDISSRVTFDAITFDDGMGGDLRSPRSIFYDGRSAELFVADAGNHRILIYDRNLKALYSFDHFVRDRYTDQMIKGEPKSAVVNSHGDIIVIDNLVDYLEVLDFRGISLERIEVSKIMGDTSLKIRPECMTIDSADNLYLAVTGDQVTVLMLDSQFRLIRRIGQKGPLPSEFNTLLAIAEAEGRLYLTDLYSSPAVKIFDTVGNYISGFAGHDIERADLSLPSGIFVSQDSAEGTLIWVTDALRQVVKVYNSNGDMLVQLGGFGRLLGEYQYPSGVAGSQEGEFFISEKVGNRIQRFRFK